MIECVYFLFVLFWFFLNNYDVYINFCSTFQMESGFPAPAEINLH